LTQHQLFAIGATGIFEVNSSSPNETEKLFKKCRQILRNVQLATLF
jgi:hypothetical protein